MTEIVASPGYFQLNNDHISYVIRLIDNKYLAHAYFGKRIRKLSADVLSRYSNYQESKFSRHEMTLDGMPQEYPTFGYGDLRNGALSVIWPDGSRTIDLIYRSHQISDGSSKISGLPASFGTSTECKTLAINLEDPLWNLNVTLYYTIYDDCDIISRHVSIHNAGTNPITIERAMSCSIDFHTSDYHLLTLSGAWTRERMPYRRPLVPGEQSVSSLRGASSHQHTPFIALSDPCATETFGDVFGFSLVYSGNFFAGVEVDQYDMSRVMIGINPTDFSWHLAPNDTFYTPEVVMTYSSDGFSGMSKAFHKLCYNHIAHGNFVSADRPVLINSWEGCLFQFNEEKLLNICELAADVGIELFVLDDGWFGKRNDPTSSLGDWIENTEKLPDGLTSLSKKIHDMNLKFGLWFEPEMISPNSELYRTHPDWCIHVKNRLRVESRHQLILDLSRPEVCEYIIKSLTDILNRVPIEYIKWDMNRNFSPIGSAFLPEHRQKELPHRYMLGLYNILETLTKSFPSVLFESCASGGGRFDLGMLYYMPQGWCSDNTDAAMRSKIQYTTSYIFPQWAMGAHISSVPNRQMKRNIPLDTRAAVAMGGVFGYEMDLTKLSENELSEISDYTAYYKKYRNLMQYGNFYRLRSPFSTNEAAWMCVSADMSNAIVTHVQMSARHIVKDNLLPLRGLNPNLTYKIEETGLLINGDELMFSGLPIPNRHNDYTSAMYTIHSINESP